MNRIFASIAAIVFFSSCSKPAVLPSGAKFDEQFAKGNELYDTTCVLCHYDGSGSPTAPDLLGSAMFDKPPTALVSLLLKGQRGVSVVNGKNFDGVMPSQAQMTNEEIAAVVIYVRKTFGQKSDELSAATVAELR